MHTLWVAILKSWVKSSECTLNQSCFEKNYDFTWMYESKEMIIIITNIAGSSLIIVLPGHKKIIYYLREQKKNPNSCIWTYYWMNDEFITPHDPRHKLEKIMTFFRSSLYTPDLSSLSN